jgi:PAS domain S-box-containing protein
VYVVNSDFLLVQVSAGAQKVFETIRPLIGRDFADIVRKIWPEPFATEAINRFRHTLDTGEPYAAPRVMERRQDIGEIESYDWRIERLMLPDGRFGVVCHFYDLSERLRYETALREGEERYRQLFEANPHPMWIFDGETLGFLAVNDAAMRQYGYTREEFLGMTIAEIHASGGEGGWRHRRKDGTEIDVEIDSHALNFAGRSARVVLAHDVTQRKHAEDALRTSEDRHRRLLEEASDGIMSVDLQGRFIMANAAACRLLGYTNDEICRLTLADTYCPEEAHLGMDRLRQAVIGGNLRFERQVRRKDGVYFTAEFCITVLPNQVIYGIFRDVTERKQLEVRLEQTVAERTARLQETLGELEAFSYSISHDLRAPLRTMSGYARVLIEDAGHKLAPEEIKHLERILRAATRLDRLINDVLDYSRLSRAEVSVVPVELEKIVDDVLQQYPAVNSHVASILVCRPLPCALGHEALLVQCVSNLLANAFKFMRPGVAPVVEIWAEIGETSVNLHVRDNGIGIAPHNLSRIFGLFQRINAAHAYEGMGIGLTIVKKAVERLGGKVRVQSIEGEGSTFSLELGKLPS